MSKCEVCGSAWCVIPDCGAPMPVVPEDWDLPAVRRTIEIAMSSEELAAAPVYEWGIWRAGSSEVHRAGCTEQEARTFIAEWEQDGGKPGVFTLIRRPMTEWQQVDR